MDISLITHAKKMPFHLIFHTHGEVREVSIHVPVDS